VFFSTIAKGKSNLITQIMDISATIMLLMSNHCLQVIIKSNMFM